jgi:hypothetical protein
MVNGGGGGGVGALKVQKRMMLGKSHKPFVRSWKSMVLEIIMLTCSP